MARSTLLQRLQWLGRLALSAEADEDFSRAKAAYESRRRVLKAVGVGAISAAMPHTALAAISSKARVLIIGAGLAGLSCAHLLKKRGIKATVFEASQRAGGRCSTNREVFGDQYVEEGGEFINSAHTEIRSLAREMGLKLEDLWDYYDRFGGDDIYFIDGARYTEEDAFNDFLTVRDQLRADLRAAPFPTTWDKHTPRAVELDNMTMAAWIEAYVPGGMASRFGQLLSIAYTGEYGAEPAEQSALNLTYLLAYSPRNEFAILGESDERYHIRGGNDRLVTRLLQEVGASNVRLEHELTRITRRSNGSYQLSFKTPSGTVRENVDHVVLALPFSILRRSVEYGEAGFDSRKRLAIETMPMGNNSKLHVEFAKRHWRDAGSSGFTYSDNGYQSEWETTLTQPGRKGVLTNYTGGDLAVAMNDATPQEKAATFVQQLDAVIPGVAEHATGRQLLNYWPGHPWSRGSYGYYAPGNYTAFVGYEGVRQGNCHFCGEHTSLESQGYLNGAVETGLRCAREIIRDLNGEGEED
jgi:monoamine oxidase